jgi:Response regulator containing a CheY-like receiver domain and an HTH DNA-binding domain
MTATRIIIADDHTLFVHGLQLLLKDEQWIKIIDVANDGKELLDILSHTKTDIVLLDINMPKLSGLDAAMHIKRTYPGLKLIIVSTYNEEHLIEKARRIGVNGYLLKNCSREELLETIRLVMNNHTSFPYRTPVTANVFDEDDSFLRQFNLTKREMEIIQLLKTNLTNQQIAVKLFLSVYTVETHRKNIMQKLHLNSPSSLMKFIFDHGL